MLFVAAYLVFSPLIFTDERMPYVWATCFVLAGFILYIPFVHFALKIPGTGENLAYSTTIAIIIIIKFHIPVVLKSHICIHESL